MKTNKKVGERIREIRESESISTAELAERSGLDENQINAIEETGAIPSLSSLVKIARLLGVRLNALYDQSDEHGPVISRKDKYEENICSLNKKSNPHRNMAYYSLSSAKQGCNMEPFIIHINPTPKGVDFVLSTHEGEEFIYCIEGVLEIKYGKETYILEEGDSIYYDSIIPHHLHAAGENGAKILAVVYTPN
ncbi:helix-turn-helix domain-containing protein [Prevotella sp. 10(H)]|uniref:helix-turn-helix domain-containing protein n=1 Tax=Prevotella sp. 10(H) TaxID=1158294 RepID=UPI0004A70F21|nr:XRE family transcriptional regulator [Prevotella sp. 10(H)]